MSHKEPAIRTAATEPLLSQLEFLGAAPRNWVPAASDIDHDVAIIGGGQSGVTIAFALRRAGIARTAVFEAASPGHEGIWRSPARMHTLRTSKTLTGPDLGIPALTFRAWYEATEGAAAYEALGFIPRTTWADYLDWHRAVTGVAVRHQTKVVGIEPAEDYLRLTLRHDGKTISETARTVVLATGFRGAGRPAVPAVLQSLPRDTWAHTSDDIDFDRLRGRRVAVIGVAASAFDAAATALEHGASSVHMFGRRSDIPHGARSKATSFAGFEHFHALPDADRWSIARAIRTRATHPPAESVRRAVLFENFRIHLDAPLFGASCDHTGITLAAGSYRDRFDFIIAGTGYSIDLSARPELIDISPHIATWGDCYAPPAGQDDAELAKIPYLGPAYQLTPKHHSPASIGNVFCFNLAAFASFGRLVGDVASMSAGIPRLVNGLGRSLFLTDRAVHVRTVLTSAIEPELTGDEYAPSTIPHSADISEKAIS